MVCSLPSRHSYDYHPFAVSQHRHEPEKRQQLVPNTIVCRVMCGRDGAVPFMKMEAAANPPSLPTLNDVS